MHCYSIWRRFMTAGMTLSLAPDTVNVILLSCLRVVFRKKDVETKNRTAADFVIVQARLSDSKAQVLS